MIRLVELTKQFGSKVLFDGVSQTIDPFQRTGLIGCNGAGKTVLLRMIEGEDSPDGGEMQLPPNLRTGSLGQEMTFGDDDTPLGFVLKPFAHLIHADTTVERLLIESAGDDSRESRRARQSLDRIEAEQRIHSAASLEPRGKSMLDGLGVPQSSWERDIRELSGGFRMRVVLAQLLLLDPDLLLLDEPTNHLDLDSLVWFERFLQKFRGGILAVSHDRDFLKRCTTHTAELENGKLTVYKGPIDRYFAWKEKDQETEENRRRTILAQIGQTKRFIERFKSKNTKASQARSKMKELDRLKELLPGEVRHGSRPVKFRMPKPGRCGSVPVKLDGVTVGYDGTPVLSDFTFFVNRGDKIAVIGPNGAGKSTVLKTCAGMLRPLAGEAVLGHNTEVRYYSQHRLDQLNPDRTVYETIEDVTGSGDRNFIQSVLGAFFFSGDEVEKPVRVLSGGEKSRLSLATMLARPGNLLLLDEPTNHLDIYSVHALADMLSGFEGTMVIVSHDEHFISRIANRIVEMRPGVVRDFPGSPQDYRSYIEAGYISELDQPEQASTKPRSSKNDRIRARKERTQLERRIRKVESTIESLEKEIEGAKSELHDPSNASNFELLWNREALVMSKQDEYDRRLKAWDHLQEELAEIDSGD